MPPRFTDEPEAQALRQAARDWVSSPIAAPDYGAAVDGRLQKAAIKLARMAKKRGYSREFTPKSDRRCTFTVDRVPPTFYEAVKGKAKREGLSDRALILSLLKRWLDE